MPNEEDVKLLAGELLGLIERSPDGFIDCNALARRALEFAEERHNKFLEWVNEQLKQMHEDHTKHLELQEEIKTKLKSLGFEFKEQPWTRSG